MADSRASAQAFIPEAGDAYPSRVLMPFWLITQYIQAQSAIVLISTSPQGKQILNAAALPSACPPQSSANERTAKEVAVHQTL